MAGRGHRDIFAEDVEWHTGQSPGIRYARLMVDEEDTSSPLVVLSTFAPGEVIDPHSHDTNYLEYILEGELRVGKNTFRKGDIRAARAGTGYGPLRVGAEGCTVLIVFQEADRAMVVPKGAARAA